ncbi:hypothetical protein QBC46DRAFT_407054 [Diplogelasinospora grovesii]|uniref:Uncharacterized protein n=1 Tax=Diplogelasinospora grovesii TaxID=303347 RepID=A0AAN6N9C0_9PEZI|nr:hypothetical protein QBC46DRAFT_407054 [Diplogelasinospora grovesii]
MGPAQGQSGTPWTRFAGRRTRRRLGSFSAAGGPVKTRAWRVRRSARTGYAWLENCWKNERATKCGDGRAPRSIWRPLMQLQRMELVAAWYSCGCSPRRHSSERWTGREPFGVGAPRRPATMQNLSLSVMLNAGKKRRRGIVGHDPGSVGDSPVSGVIVHVRVSQKHPTNLDEIWRDGQQQKTVAGESEVSIEFSGTTAKLVAQRDPALDGVHDQAGAQRFMNLSMGRGDGMEESHRGESMVDARTHARTQRNERWAYVSTDALPGEASGKEKKARDPVPPNMAFRLYRDVCFHVERSLAECGRLDKRKSRGRWQASVQPPSPPHSLVMAGFGRRSHSGKERVT